MKVESQVSAVPELPGEPSSRDRDPALVAHPELASPAVPAGGSAVGTAQHGHCCPCALLWALLLLCSAVGTAQHRHCCSCALLQLPAHEQVKGIPLISATYAQKRLS